MGHLLKLVNGTEKYIILIIILLFIIIINRFLGYVRQWHPGQVSAETVRCRDLQ